MGRLMPGKGGLVDLGPADLADGELREATAEGLSLVVARTGGRYVAFETWCSHEECPLSDGWLDGDAIRCACHGALFSLSDGAALEGPALDPITVVGASVTADGRVVADISTLHP
jgi:nitrite reductase/ring-hydroxylating ferredoxin subunit